MFDRLKNAFKSLTNTIVNSITTTELSDDKLNEIHDELFMQLVESDVAVDVADAICNAIINYLRGLKVPRFGDKESVIRNGILDVMNRLFNDVPDVDFMSEVIRILQVKRPVVLLFLGPNGYGKTTTIAKITHQLMKKGYTAVWAAADTYRLGPLSSWRVMRPSLVLGL